MRARGRVLLASGVGLAASAVVLGYVIGSAAGLGSRTDKVGEEVTSTAPDVAASAATLPSVALSVSDLDCTAQVARRAAGTVSFRPASVVRAFWSQRDASDRASLHRQLVADLAGIDPFVEDDSIRLEGVPLRPPRIDRLLPPLRQPTLGSAHQHRLAAALAAPAVDGFIAAARDDPAALRHGWHHISLKALLRDDSALAHALRVRGDALLPRIQEIPAAAFGLHELAATIEQGIDAADFVALLDGSALDATSTWKHYTLTRPYNLAVFAAVHARPHILRALVARGVVLPPGSPSVLDELALALSATNPTPDALADVAGQLAGLGERPFLPSTAGRLAAVVPGLSVPPLHPDTEAALVLPEVRDRAERLTGLLRHARTKVEEAQRIVDRCKDVWLSNAGDDAPDLASKLAQHEVIRDRKQHSLQARFDGAQALATGLSSEFLDVGERVGAAIAAGNWHEALDLLDGFRAAAPAEIAADVPVVLLKLALDSAAPLDVVHALIQRNDGVLPADFILTLLKSDREDIVQVASDLEAWGLDPGFADADGRNAVNHLMDGFRSRIGPTPGLGETLGWLNYLASRSVSPQPLGKGLDPLDTVLFAALDGPASGTASDAVLLARALVEVGASVQPSHREIATRIQVSAPETYAALVEAIPELGI